jgi:ABC-type phosphate/phosphonate transport system substrate-binding protein
MAGDAILLGAVAYDPKVVSIWEGIRAYFRAAPWNLAFDFALFSNYERQVEELLAGHIDIAWNTPLAHVRVQRRTEGRSRSLGMRDSDRDVHSKIVVNRTAGIRSIGELAGKTLAVGSRDSTQARILPLYFLKEAGFDPARATLLPFDTDLGKHGDTGSSELEVLRAIADGRAQAGCVGDLIWVNEQAAGRVDPNRVEVLLTTPGFDHCMFDAMPSFEGDRATAFQRALFSMKWEVAEHRRLLELEGLKEWMEPRESGYNSLRRALDDQGGW